jgi:Xaa-Pro aminopeptidase
MTAKRAVAADAVAEDERIASMLRAHGAGLDLAGVQALIRGVASAPPAFERDAWMGLVAQDPSQELRDTLAALLAEETERRRRAATSGRPAADTAARLAALRAELRRRRLTGFVVPRGDEHQGEYVAAHSERLAWLTGFTGSAGVAVVLADQAALFVDGRYTAQATTEVDTGLIEIRHMTQQPMTAWLTATLPAKSRLGYDPWLHTPNQAMALRSACGKAQARAVAVNDNPVDAIWHDQPPPPLAPIVPHDLAFAGTSSVDKRVLVAATLQADKQDVAFLAQPDSIAWLLNIRGGDISFSPLPLAFALVNADTRVQLFTDPRKLAGPVRDHLGENVTVHPPDDLTAVLRALASAGKTVRLDPDTAPEWVAHRLRADGATLAEAPDPCALPKATKTGAELAAIRAAHRRDGAALSRFLCWLEQAAAPGRLSELEAAEKLAAFRAEGEHYRGPSFPTISAAGPHGAIVHYRVSPATDARLEPDSLYLVDSGAQYLDGTTDVTRTVCIGKPTQEMRERYTLVLKGHIAIAIARFPRGTTGSQIDALARVAMWRNGLDYDHGTGHGVGFYLGVHEGPQRISKLPSRIALQPGMVVSNEPGYYKQGCYGIRIENLVVVTPMGVPVGGEQAMLGFDALTLAPFESRLIEYALLDNAEIDWLDGYHQQVWEDIAPLVDTSTREWLYAATQPIRLCD